MPGRPVSDTLPEKHQFPFLIDGKVKPLKVDRLVYACLPIDALMNQSKIIAIRKKRWLFGWPKSVEQGPELQLLEVSPYASPYISGESHSGMKGEMDVGLLTFKLGDAFNPKRGLARRATQFIVSYEQGVQCSPACVLD
jgi:hypothetical protein